MGSTKTPMNQTKLESFIEAFINTLSGFLISVTIQAWILTALEVPNAVSHSVWITVVFTVVSLLRNYAWRRFFARAIHKKIQVWAILLLKVFKKW